MGMLQTKQSKKNQIIKTMNYEELFQQTMKGDKDALRTLCEMAGSGYEEAQYVLSRVYDNVDSPFRNVDLGMHWLKTSAGYDYEPAIKKIKELPSDIKRQYGLETDSDHTDAKTSNEASNSILSYEGRIGRVTYFIYIIIYALIFGIFLAVIKTVASDSKDPFWVMLGSIIQIIRIYLIGAISVKRLHDCGHSGWWALLMPITQIVIQFWPGEDKDNEYGPQKD